MHTITWFDMEVNSIHNSSNDNEGIWGKTLMKSPGKLWNLGLVGEINRTIITQPSLVHTHLALDTKII